jgi:5,5'-dehydrodivanillate O-demethylase
VSDDSHISFKADTIAKTGANADAYRIAQDEKKKRRAAYAPAIETVQKILTGAMHPDDIAPDHPDIIMIQDGVACMGQKAQRDRGADLLGASDRQVGMVRRLWNRELSALRDGGALKQWRIPHGLATTRGV